MTISRILSSLYKVIAAAVVISASAAPLLHSQQALADISLSDLESPIYADLQMWEEAGFIPGLPIMRPYSYQQVLYALQHVIAKADSNSEAAVKAGEYYRKLNTPDPRYAFSFTPQFRVSGDGEEDGFYTNTPPGLGFAWNIQESDRGKTWAELHYEAQMLDSENASALPAGVRETSDYIPDWSDIDLFGRNISIRQFVYSLLDISRMSMDGRAATNFRVGTHRSSAGPFHNDGILISPDAPAAGHFSLNYGRQFGKPDSEGFSPGMNYASQLSILSATDDNGEGRYGGKYMMFHMLRVQAADWLSLGIIESVVWGERLELYYLIPLSSYFLNQGLTGFGDNSLLGVEAIFTPAASIKIPVQIYADDVHFNDIIRFEFNTKYKFAAQTGISWTPLVPWLQRLSFDYSAVMPYMYTHWDERTQVFDSSRGGDANYSNYTHRGENIGPGLDPNSDRWRLEWKAEPISGSNNFLPGLELGLNSAIQYMRHGNASAGIIDGASGDIFDPGYIGRTPTFQAPYPEEQLNGQPYTRFLTQDVLEHTLQLSLETDVRLRSVSAEKPAYRGPALNMGLGYTLERIWNRDLIAGDNSWGHYFRVDFTISFP
ncbi:TonB-dependent receptor [Salinispira pacifica]|uniref:Capsule assembly Wzi family protein n=1 Tax=Salinispira pacifica TaxID=1307761 RepID=V5WMP4_9SPIO|nr:TonB-dependent receptor [Salinispira pacifica]AHC16451.1 hypothetical protein L21SP2_3109 [Salinispira pacifica]